MFNNNTSFLKTVRLGNPIHLLEGTRFAWSLHNIFAHPMSEVLYQLGCEDLGNWLHDVTIPPHEEGEGRG